MILSIPPSIFQYCLHACIMYVTPPSTSLNYRSAYRGRGKEEGGRGKEVFGDYGGTLLSISDKWTNPKKTFFASLLIMNQSSNDFQMKILGDISRSPVYIKIHKKWIFKKNGKKLLPNNIHQTISVTKN